MNSAVIIAVIIVIIIVYLYYTSNIEVSQNFVFNLVGPWNETKTVKVTANKIGNIVALNIEGVSADSIDSRNNTDILISTPLPEEYRPANTVAIDNIIIFQNGSDTPTSLTVTPEGDIKFSSSRVGTDNVGIWNCSISYNTSGFAPLVSKTTVQKSVIISGPWENSRKTNVDITYYGNTKKIVSLKISPTLVDSGKGETHNYTKLEMGVPPPLIPLYFVYETDNGPCRFRIKETGEVVLYQDMGSRFTGDTWSSITKSFQISYIAK